MCGRYSLIAIDDLGTRFRITDPSFGFRSHFNITPGSMVPVIARRERTEAVLMEWGLIPHWVKERNKAKPLINARAETLNEKPSFKNLLSQNRCLVPASGFYEWKKDGARKTPFYIRLRDSTLFAFAGLYDMWVTPAGEGFASYTIITTEPNGLIAPVHNRMPVILNRENESRWLSNGPLSASDLATILTPYPPGEMEMYPVAPFVNNPKADDERLIERVRGL
ncbi:MAG: SOS response-associated peptidase [Methanoregula sp.]|nr:MAG: SOS response-associated peptidase [Methanoregula sp.]